MKVRTREEAWKEVDKIFPTDYYKDEQSSQRAGYPIIRSTADDVNAWISDLNCRLEVNIQNPETKEIESTNIWISGDPEIVETVSWSYETVRECCIKNNLYTCGTVRQYDLMFQMVMAKENPELIDIYNVAKDIAEHSEDQTVTNVMYLLNKDAIVRLYEVRA